jgi:FAD/FMN-containing dehydrogenase
VSYFESQAAGFVPRPFAHFQTNVIIPDFNGGASEAIAAAIHAAPPQFRVLIVVLSGAITRVPLTDMAFPLRHPGFEIDMLGTWTTPADKPADVQWVKALRDKLQPLALGAYGNQLGETSDQLAMAAYGPNYARLRDIKKKYDPTNVLRINQNIKPA